MAKFDIKDKAFRNLIEERDKFYGLKSDEFQRLNNAVDQYKKSNFFAKLFNVGDAKKAQKEFEELKENKYFKQVLTNYGFEFDSKGDIQKAEWYANQTKQGVPEDIQKAEWYANQTKQGVPDGTVLEQPSPSQFSRSGDRSIGQYARIPSQQPLNYLQGAVQQGQGPEMLPPGQYHQVPSQQQQYAVPNTYSSADLALKTPQSPVHQQFGSQFSDPQKLQQTPQPQTQPQPQPQITRVDITKLFDVVRTNDVEALKEMIKANKSYVNVARDTDGYSPLHFAPNKQIAEMLVQAGADVNAKAKDGSNPVDWAQNNPELKQYLDGEVQKRNLPQGAALPQAGGIYSSAQLARQEYAGVDGSRNSQGDIYVVPPTKPVTGTGPDAPSTGTRSQLSPQSEVLNTFGTPQGGIYGGTDALSARDAEANKKAYEAEVAQQRPASAPPVSMQIHKTPTNVSPQLAQQQYAGASSVQPQPLAPAKRQLPTPPVTNASQSKSPSIAAKQAALFGEGRAVVGTGVATGRLAAAPKGSGLQK